MTTVGPGLNVDPTSPGARGPGLGVGASLAQLGQGVEQQGTQAIAAASQMQTNREAQNTILTAQETAGKQQLGGTLGGLAGMEYGMQAGSIGGPMGALIGGAIGALAGGLFK